MKKFKHFYIFILLSIIISIFDKSAYANSAPPMPNKFGTSGIFFEKFEDIGINKEVLDIIVDDEKIKYTATYQMENLTNQPLDVFTMFMIPPIGDFDHPSEESIDVKQNGVSLNTNLNLFYSKPSNDKNDNWEDILNKSSENTQTLGDGTGFYKYYITATSSVKFTASSHFYVISNDYYYDNTSKECRLMQSTEVITKQDLSEFAFEKEVVPNVYDALIKDYDYASGVITRNAVMKFYFSEVTADNFEIKHLDSFNLNFLDSVYTVDYNLSFSPNQKSIVSVTYSFNLPKRRNDIEINYLLSPAKYWHKFEDLTINLSLNSNFCIIESSNLPFSKVSKNQYQYKSASLPQNDLNMKVRKTKIDSFGSNILMASPYLILFFVIFVLPFYLTILAILIVFLIVRKAIKRRKIRKFFNLR